ncbi:hypothetical protein Ngar_c03760 [Candidatus Nitrososphaera gargensis Ga9.2]|uniref:Uncharacterized protein n=1 Tax=Nitrososphaera gargensis (strain Ga9.2) TaxID=1237085 RepID=K0ILT5_NITGG|nr:hypothetical protein Ngar_c03760 [Candidatus Nitrososphaera gargensis Ga9.2]
MWVSVGDKFKPFFQSPLFGDSRFNLNVLFASCSTIFPFQSPLFGDSRFNLVQYC